MRAVALCALVSAAGCGGTGDPRFAPYRCETLRYEYARLRFPPGSVDAVERAGGRLAWARLVPDGRSPTDTVERYLIDLGRPDTGTGTQLGYQLGYGHYPDDAARTRLEGGYTLHCTPPARRVPAFNCAVLLRSLPRAALQLARVPASAGEARAMVDEAETFLRLATQGRDGGAAAHGPADRQGR